MTTYDPKTDLCPLCGAYWEHDFDACAKEHGFTVDDSKLNNVPVFTLEQIDPRELSFEPLQNPQKFTIVATPPQQA